MTNGPETTAELARTMVRLDHDIQLARFHGHWATAFALEEQREEVRAHRSTVLRVQWQERRMSRSAA